MNRFITKYVLFVELRYFIQIKEKTSESYVRDDVQTM